MSPDRVLHFLVIATDPSLGGEVEDALGTLRGVRGVVRQETDIKRGCHVARDRQPDVVILGMDDDVRQTATELTASVPGLVVLGCYRADTLDSGAGPRAVIDVLRASVRDFLQRPVSSFELNEVLRRLVLDGHRASTRAGRIVSFVSNKGGVGKSTLAVNTACRLAERYPDDVLLVDASLQLGVCQVLLGLRGGTTLVDAVDQAERLDERLLRTLATPHPSGLRLLAAPRDAMEAARVDENGMARVLTVARRAFRYVVVDTFPMLDAVALTILDASDEVEVVTTSQLPNVEGVRVLLGVLERLGVPPERRRLVLNEAQPRFSGGLSVQDIADQLDCAVDHVIPHQRSVLVAANTGKPAVLAGGRFNRFRRRVNALALAVERHAVRKVADEEPREHGSGEAEMDPLTELGS